MVASKAIRLERSFLLVRVCSVFLIFCNAYFAQLLDDAIVFFENCLFERFGVFDKMYGEFFLLSCRLDSYVAEGHEGCENAAYIDSDVLDLIEPKRSNFAGEESFLFRVDDAFVGDDEHVKIVIRPDDECADPDEEEPREKKEYRERHAIPANFYESIRCDRYDHEHCEQEERYKNERYER